MKGDAPKIFLNFFTFLFFIFPFFSLFLNSLGQTCQHAKTFSFQSKLMKHDNNSFLIYMDFYKACNVTKARGMKELKVKA